MASGDRLSDAMRARGMKPPAELGANREHGTRMRYKAGCKCFKCRSANTAYEAMRKKARDAGEWNGIVPADKAREHLVMLSRKGVGRDAISHASGVAITVIEEVRKGRKANVRAATERALLRVSPKTDLADGAYKSAKKTWAMLDELIRDGYTRGALARMLGAKTPALQIRRTRTTVRKEADVEKLYRRLRRIDASETKGLLDELAAEGFRRDRIRERIDHHATLRGIPLLDVAILTPNNGGRISAVVAELVAIVHKELTE